jgi:hypothetical protein
VQPTAPTVHPAGPRAQRHVEKAPAGIDNFSNRSWGPGLRRDKLSEVATKEIGKMFESKSLPADVDALKALREYLDEGKPVAIQYMMGSSTAH